MHKSSIFSKTPTKKAVLASQDSAKSIFSSRSKGSEILASPKQEKQLKRIVEDLEKSMKKTSVIAQDKSTAKKIICINSGIAM